MMEVSRRAYGKATGTAVMAGLSGCIGTDLLDRSEEQELYEIERPIVAVEDAPDDILSALGNARDQFETYVADELS
jgi:hypothetical protein